MSKKYFELDALSSSEMRSIIKGYGAYRAYLARDKKDENKYDEFEKGDAVTIGNGVDIILTEGREKFNELYVSIESPNLPNDKPKEVIRELYENGITDLSLPKSEPVIIAACEKHEYYNNDVQWDRRLKVIREFQDYLNYLVNTSGKFVVTGYQQQSIDALVTIFYSKYADIFMKRGKLIPEISIVFQYSIQWLHKKVHCKALLDCFIINKSDETIELCNGEIVLDPKSFTVIDVKTTGYYSNQTYDLITKHGLYDIQIGHYILAADAISPDNYKPNSKHYLLIGYVKENKVRTIPLDYEIDIKNTVFIKWNKAFKLHQCYKKHGISEPLMFTQPINSLSDLIEDHVF